MKSPDLFISRRGAERAAEAFLSGLGRRGEIEVNPGNIRHPDMSVSSGFSAVIQLESGEVLTVPVQ